VRIVDLYTYGPDRVEPWEDADDDDAARILCRADEPIPASWRRLVEVGGAEG
jgi:hypothetical protein